jgi:hypothetical protein
MLTLLDRTESGQCGQLGEPRETVCPPCVITPSPVAVSCYPALPLVGRVPEGSLWKLVKNLSPKFIFCGAKDPPPHPPPILR